jgi:hypothetical protein
VSGLWHRDAAQGGESEQVVQDLESEREGDMKVIFRFFFSPLFLISGDSVKEAFTSFTFLNIQNNKHEFLTP